MKAMILAAGRGERCRPLTDTIPKPLIEVQGEALIVRHIKRLKAIGVEDIVINLAHLGEKIQRALGQGDAWGVNIRYSFEPEGALETGGGIHKALPLLGPHPFLMLNGDVYTDYPLENLSLANDQLAHLVLVPNPDFNLQGDFHLSANGAKVKRVGLPNYTLSGIAVYHPKLLQGASSGRFSVVPFLDAAMQADRVTGEIYTGLWRDVGTLERYHALLKETTC